MAAEEEKRKKDFLIKEEVFRKRAFIIINQMAEWNERSSSSGECTALLVDEVLHSIFFLGMINRPSYSPEDILLDEHDKLKNKFPRPFDHYSFHLPKRSPFSCVLDMIVHLTGETNENEIKEELIKFKRKLLECGEGKHLISNTMCVSQTETSRRYYGVSMSTCGSNPGKIMVAASCLSYWDNYVAAAVMTYFPGNAKNKDFDGTLKLPETVTCKAFELRAGKEIPPCRACRDLFGLKETEKNEINQTKSKQWPYGNCAEVESVSNLFKNEKVIKEHARLTSNSYTDQERKTVEDNVNVNLVKLLAEVKWKPEFYTAK